MKTRSGFLSLATDLMGVEARHIHYIQVESAQFKAPCIMAHDLLPRWWARTSILGCRCFLTPMKDPDAFGFSILCMYHAYLGNDRPDRMYTGGPGFGLAAGGHSTRRPSARRML
jgi:hypothetical protein